MCILLVEDEWIVLQDMADALERAGYEVMATEHGRAACDCIDQHPNHFSCLVADLNLPGGVSGLDVVEYMRPRYPDVPMVLVTATPNNAPLSSLIGHNVWMLVKPCETSEVVRLIGKLLPRPAEGRWPD